MICNLKILGLAVVAIFAMSAIAAAAASAAPQLTSDGPVKLDITESGTNGLSAFGGTTTCSGSTLTGFKYNVTPHASIPASGESTVTVVPDYNQLTCKVVEGPTTHKATVTTTGCDYVLHLGTLIGGSYPLTADVECETGKKIEVEVYPFANSELTGVACTIKIGTQTGLAGASAKNHTGVLNDLEASGTFTSVHAEKSGPGCTTESTTTGTFELNATITGTSAEGGATTLLISG